MKSVNVHEAKTHLSRLLERVERGEEVVISRAGTPVAKLVAVAASKRILGADRGRVRIASDFDAPLPDEMLADFER
jgi:prevent-host-death family protein